MRKTRVKQTDGGFKSNVVLFGALFANLGIAIAKFVAAGLTGSSAMLTEGVHSLVDSGNQLLLLYGKRRARGGPDALHPFGYGRELYFWSFVVAILIFALGAGVSIYEGWAHFRDPEPLRDPTVNYVVLAVAMLLEGGSWSLAVREFNADRRGVGWWAAMRRSKDPTSFIVLFEDSAALIGLAVAAVGVWAAHQLGDPRMDGVASMLIGAVLAMVAGLLAREAKGLLIGESAEPELIASIWRQLEGRAGVTCVNHVRTVHIAPTSVFAAISVDFDDALPMGEAETLIESMEQDLKRAFPQLASIYIRPEKAACAVRQPNPTSPPIAVGRPPAFPGPDPSKG